MIDSTYSAARQAAIAAAQTALDGGQSVEAAGTAAAGELAKIGMSGKNLDHKARQIVRQMTGVMAEPGAARGTVRADGSTSYRA